MLCLIADGGCKPGKSYGSFLILKTSFPARTIQHRTFDLPKAATNNEAEYGALLRGLKAVLILEPRVRKIRVMMDSKVVLKHIDGEWECRAENLKPLCQEAINLLGEFEEIVLEHVDRETIVSFLGH